jgi:hypothetical protein
MHPDMVARLVTEHQRDLLRDAERDRLAALARGKRAGFGTRLMLRVSAGLIAAGRALRPRERAASGVHEIPQRFASN